MNASQIMSFARKLSKWVSESQITEEEMLVILNESYKDFYKKIIDLDKNYFWDRWTADVVADQYEYSILQPSGTTFGMFKPEKVRIKYTTTSDFVDVSFKERDNLEETPEYYADNQSTDDPFLIITDRRYLNIFPTPTTSITWWLLFEGAKKPYDLVADSWEWDIIIDPLYHKTIAYMMVPIIEKTKWNINEKNDALIEAEREMIKSLKSMWVLTTKAIRAKTKDLTWLE